MRLHKDYVGDDGGDSIQGYTGATMRFRVSSSGFCVLRVWGFEFSLGFKVRVDGLGFRIYRV